MRFRTDFELRDDSNCPTHSFYFPNTAFVERREFVNFLCHKLDLLVFITYYELLFYEWQTEFRRYVICEHKFKTFKFFYFLCFVNQYDKYQVFVSFHPHEYLLNLVSIWS